MPASAVSCPACKRSLTTAEWRTETGCECPRCLTHFEVIPFTALHQASAPPKPQDAVLAEDSTCFFHVTNQAEKVCDSCGRFVCAVCAIPHGSSFFCPKCIGGADTSDKAPARRLMYSGLALGLALLPLLFWPITIITSLATLVLVVIGWRKPASLVHGRRPWRFVLAGVIAGAQLVGWTLLGLELVGGS